VPITFIDANPFPKYSGGMENWLFHLVAKLDERHIHTVIFASRSDGPPFHNIHAFRHLKLIEMPAIHRHQRSYALFKRFFPAFSFLPVALNYASWLVGAWWVIRKHVRKQDRLFALHPIPAMLPLVLFRCLGGRNVITCSVRGKVGADLREMNKPILAWFYTKIEKSVLRFASQVVSNGEDTAAYVRSELGVESKVMPNGVDFARFANSDFYSCQENNSWVEELVRLRQQ
jgi:hypothetical protein